MNSDKTHWQTVYKTKAESSVSWYQANPSLSLALIQRYLPQKDAAILDAGAGASVLVDTLLSHQYTDITCLDISQQALSISQERLGSKAEQVFWVESEITRYTHTSPVSLWHDRAVFHFLTEPEQQTAYRETLHRNLAEDGHAIIATFAPDGPEKCSGLNIVQYDDAKISEVLGENFVLLDTIKDTHTTPMNTTQSFNYFVFARRGCQR